MINENISIIQIIILARREWEGKLKDKSQNKVKHMVEENDAGIDIDSELRHEENSKSFNEKQTDTEDTDDE